MSPGQLIRQVDAQLRYFFHVDPDQLSDDKYGQLHGDLVWIRKELKKQSTL